jgi:hypothetical protein
VTYHGFDRDLGPADCPFGHFFAPGTYQTGWMPCVCPPAMETGLHGHRVWYCGTCEASGIRAVCYSPPHCPAEGQGALTRS